MESKMKFDDLSQVVEYLNLTPKYGFKEIYGPPIYSIKNWLETECIFRRMVYLKTPRRNIITRVIIHDIGFNEYFINLRSWTGFRDLRRRYVGEVDIGVRYFIVQKDKKWNIRAK